ncbi:Leucine Rich repeats (2 copies) [Planctomycetes bacterium MalM25]|nr:Leucine Rich repeats (2 copies) [Planctomycetes bacterium MalM25]
MEPSSNAHRTDQVPLPSAGLGDGETAAAPSGSGRRTFVLLMLTILVAALGAFGYVQSRNGQLAAREAEAKAELQKLGVFLTSSGSGEHVGNANLSLVRTPENFERAMELLADLPWLEVVALSGQQVNEEQLASLASLTKLDSLQVSNTGIGDSALAVLARFPALGSLHVNGNALTNACLDDLGSLTSLEVLDLSETDLSGDLAPLAGLTELNWLVLRGVPLDDAALATLAGLPKLKRLTLEEGQITREQYAKLQQGSGLQVDGMGEPAARDQ